MNIEQLAEQTRLKSKSALFALIGLILSPLTVVHASPPPADSVPFWAFDEYEKRRRDHLRPAAKRLAGLNVGEPRTVRMIYFLPNDRSYRQEVVDKMKAAIRRAQSFFAEQMQAHGYGNTTFRFETDERGEPLVHRFDAKHSATHYSYSGDPWIYSERRGWIRSHFFEVREVFDIFENIYVMYTDFPGDPAQGWRDSKKTGGVNLPLWAVNWKIVSHELGHAFGLPHDFRDNSYIMSYGGWERDQISACAAKFLSVNPYFNSDISWPDTWPDEGRKVDSSSPRIELTSPTPPSGPVLFGPYKEIGDDGWVEVKYAAGLESLPIRIRITDSDGIHQVLFNASPGYEYGGGLRECRSFDGEKDVVIEFDYDGSSMSAHLEETITNLSYSPHWIHLAVVDTDGNMREAQFDLKETVPSAEFYTLTKIAGDEQQGSAGTALAEPFVVSVLDQEGLAFAGVVVTFSVTAGGGVLSATTATTDANGRARSTLTLGSEPGTNTVVATVAGLEPETFTATATEQTPYTLTKVSGDGQEGMVGTALTKPFVVSVLDQEGVTFAGAVVRFSVTTGGGSLSATTATTNANGRARSTLTLGSEPGSNTVTATVAGLEPVTFTATATEQTAHSLTKVSGDNQAGPASTQLAAPLVVSVSDQDGSPLAGVDVTFSVAAGGGMLSATTASNSCAVGSSTSSATVITDANGQAATRLTLGSESGTNPVTATVAGLEPVTFTATAAEQAMPHRLTKVCGDDQEGTVGASLTAPLVVSVSAEDGAAMAGVIVSFAVTAGGGTLSSATATTNANGRAATRLTLGSGLGTNTVSATVEGLASVTFTATGQEDPLVSLFDTFLGGGKLVALPNRTQLLQNAPNPFNSQTVLSYFLLEPGPVRLEVFALSGQRVAVLHQGLRQAGYHRLHWDGRDAAGPYCGQRCLSISTGDRRDGLDAQAHPAAVAR